MNNHNDRPTPYLTHREAAQRLSVSTKFLDRRADALGIPRHRVGNTWRYHVDELDGWVTSR